MTLATMVGVDGRQQWETRWVMTWVMSNDVGDGDNGRDNAGNGASKGDGGDVRGEGGGGLLVENAAAAAAAATAAVVAAYCWGCVLFIVKIFCVCGIFIWGGNWQGHTSPHTLVMLEVCRCTFGWGW